MSRARRRAGRVMSDLAPRISNMRPTKPLTIVDLFSGAGGLSTGFTTVSGFRPVAAVEHDGPAAATYSANHPGVDVYVGDIAIWLRGDALPLADLVVGGPPCQGFSNLGSRSPRDPRNALWRRYLDALMLIRPKYFVLENVSDFLRSGQFGALYRETRPSGRLAAYRIQSGILNAADFGAPQLRRRAVVIGSRRELTPPGLPVGRLNGRPEDWSTVRAAIGDLDVPVERIELPGIRSQTVAGILPGPFRTDELHVGRRPTEVSMLRYAAIPPGGNRYDLPDHLLADCWRGHTGSGDVMGRMHWERPSVTIRTEFWKPEKGRYLHPEANRAITHHEAARLQGFPDHYLWYGSKSSIGRQIGNAVPIALAEGIAHHLQAHALSTALREGK